MSEIVTDIPLLHFDMEDLAEYVETRVRQRVREELEKYQHLFNNKWGATGTLFVHSIKVSGDDFGVFIYHTPDMNEGLKIQNKVIACALEFGSHSLQIPVIPDFSINDILRQSIYDYMEENPQFDERNISDFVTDNFPVKGTL